MVCSDYGRIADGRMLPINGGTLSGADETRGYHLPADLKQKITHGLKVKISMGHHRHGMCLSIVKNTPWLRDELGASAVIWKVAMAQAPKNTACRV